MIETRTAKLFKNGASQAVRLPAEFRFEGEEVFVSRDEATLVALCGLVGVSQGADKVPAALDFKMQTLSGQPVELSKYLGKVVLIVNVASECGLTPQYEQLQALHKQYAGQGLAIVGVPANEFGAQEPGSNAEIATFCKANYGVEFDMLSKVVVKGDGICPLYDYLTNKSKFPGPIGWN